MNCLVSKPNKSLGERALLEPVTSILAFRLFLISAHSFPSIGNLIAQKACIHRDISSQTCLRTRRKGISIFEFSKETSKPGCHNKQQFLRLPDFQPRAISGIQLPILATDKRVYVLLAHS